jgi:hypothetical protein
MAASSGGQALREKIVIIREKIKASKPLLLETRSYRSRS